MMAAPGRKRSMVEPSGQQEDNPSPVGLPETWPLLQTAEDFRLAAVHIFGSHGWVRQTSLRLGVDESTIWRWANEQTVIKPYALAAMSAWLQLLKLTGAKPPLIERK